MKEQRLTTKILKTLKPSEIIYAEYAEGGAMGCPGTARIYAEKQNTLQFYLVSIIPQKSQEDLDVYVATVNLLGKLAEKNQLAYEYAGYGNHAYKNPNLKFTRDDDHATFICGDYKITPSCNGTYYYTVAKFAEREVSIDTLKSHHEKISPELSAAEDAFYRIYLDQLDQNDHGLGIFNIKPSEYWDAIEYLRFKDQQNFNLSDSALLDGVAAIQKYRLLYLVNKLGWNAIDNFFADYSKANDPNLFKALKPLVGENLSDIYASQIHSTSSRTSLNTTDDESIAQLFHRPALIKFTDEARHTIIQDILRRSGSELRADAESIAFFFANFIFHEDIWPYTEIIPAAVHVIEKLPFDDFNHTNTPELYWLAGEILDRAWRYLEESDNAQKKYRDLIYNTYWPRIGDLWPIIHYGEYKFNDEAASKMFNDTLGFVMSLKDLPERKPFWKDYLDLVINNGCYHPAAPVHARAVYLSQQNLSAKESFDMIIAKEDHYSYERYFSYPEDLEDAEVLMHELFRTDDEAPLQNYARIEVFEGLLLTPNSIGVGEYILKYLNDHFDEYVHIITSDSEAEDADPLDVLTGLYTALSKGASEENEFPHMKSLAAKLKSYLFTRTPAQINPHLLKDGADATPIGIDYYIDQIDTASKVARKHRRTILFQRSALQKFF